MMLTKVGPISGNVAQHSNSARNRPNFGEFDRNWRDFRRMLPGFDQIWACSAELGPTSAHFRIAFDRTWELSTEQAHISARIGPNLAGSVPDSAKFG